MSTDGLMVSVSGIRGRVGEALTPEVVAQYAAAFGAWSAHQARPRDGKARIVVGRDSRVSGPMFHRVALSALQSVGCDIIDIGLTTTPTCQLAVEYHHAAGGLMISASHNPIEWNALKFIGPTGLFLEASQGTEMRALIDGTIPRATWDRLGTIEIDDRAIARHIDRVLAIPYLDVDGIRGRHFAVALDCVRGAGSAIMPELLERLGLPTSRRSTPKPMVGFLAHPNPCPRILASWNDSCFRPVRRDRGSPVDPDVDRLAVVSNEGKAIGEDFTLALAARVVLRHRRGVVVTNLSTSRIVEDVAVAAGVPIVRSPVGEVNVAVRMRDEQAPIGGEGNGGVILSELHLGRDAPVGAALILQLLHEENRSLSEIVAGLPKYVIVKDKLDRPAAPLGAVYEALRAAFPDADADAQDGLRLAWSDRWVHVRPSGTEPIVRVIAEAPTDAAARELVRRSRAPLDALAAQH